MTRTIALAMLAVMLSGCLRIHFKGSDIGSDNVYFTNVEGRMGTRFSESDSASWLFWGLVPLGKPSPREKLGRHLGGKKKIANFRITTEYQFLDYLLAGLTIGIYASRTIKYQGDIVE